MAEHDLIRFIDKVGQLQALVQSLEADPQRRDQLASCSAHNQVVSLAKSWGFDIGRRWGETATGTDQVDNLFQTPCPPIGEEASRELASGTGWTLNLICSNAFSSPAETWMDQSEMEWVLVLRGSAQVSFKEADAVMDLSPGDHLLIPPNCLHRVERSDPDPGTLWLAMYWHA
ncbi:Nif11 domain/cupin domain-containing protein [bacterium]|jgi:cupin 2 domain-containing protein|nr:Nif11 domain/cupin domain-containing protein [bacterium]